MKFEAPTKHFVIGEYSVLEGGPAVIWTSPPFFQLRIGGENESAAGKKSLRELFHPDSPAGRLLRRWEPRSQSVFGEFFDSPLGVGGLGRSSAEYLLLWKALSCLGASEPDEIKLFQDDVEKNWIWEMWTDYRKDSSAEKSESAGKSWPPSGADIVAQACGGLVEFSYSDCRAEGLSWDGIGLKLLFLKTPWKTPTHLHLNELGEFLGDELRGITNHFLSALKLKNQSGIVESIQEFESCLARSDLRDSRSRALIAEFAKHKDVLAAKACGALGADVLMLVLGSDLDHQSETQLERLWSGFGLKEVSRMGDFSHAAI